MLTADRVIALAIMGLSVYFMIHATVLPIGWNGRTGGPGGGAFPFWLSLVMFLSAAGILARSFIGKAAARRDDVPFFDQDTIGAVAQVAIALVLTIAAMSYLGAYIVIVLFMFWYLKIFGKHGWKLTLALVLPTPIFLFFFFEVTLRILLPKGWTEPLFFPLYAMFF